MADQSQSEIIESNPIGKGLDAFRASFNSICGDGSIPSTLDALGQLVEEGKKLMFIWDCPGLMPNADIQNLALDLLSALRNLPAVRLLRSKTNHNTLRNDLLKLNSAISSDNFDFDRIKPLLIAALADKPDDSEIWGQVYNAVIESTPPPRPIASYLQQTPWLHTTRSFANSSEHRKYVDDVLKEELGPMYVGLRGFHKTYFGDVAGLQVASEAFFQQCMKGSNPLFNAGWRGWPKKANQDDVLSWFAGFCNELVAFAEGQKSILTHQRRPLAQPNTPMNGFTVKRKMDVGFVNDPKARKDSRCRWSQILVPGELNSNPSADKASEAWLDLGRYVREVLAAQDTRRFVLGFTLCGSLMRVWEFDRLGGIASDQFDINEDGLQFVSTILGFLWMNQVQLGFDPTIITLGGKRFIEIERDGRKERLILDKLMKRAPCIAGQATTCWKAYREGDAAQSPLVIKDSWQYTEREEEGELVREATDRGVVNVARYYYHETLQVHGTDDDIQDNVRGGLDITTAKNYRVKRSAMLQSTSVAETLRKGQRSTAGLKRSSSQTGAPLPPTKRSCSASPTKAASSPMANRVHRRVIVRDYGKPICEASSRLALLAAFECCTEGHKSLHEAGFLHRDISISNLLINEDYENPSWPSFLIDLDLAVKEQREDASGAKGKTGTRAFMAIGALLDERYSFMHDLESFFWVLFWICIHYSGPGKNIGPSEFESWNYEDDGKLARSKLGTIGDESMFLKIAEENFTAYYRPLIPWVNRLRRMTFPNGERWKKEDSGLYSRMTEILREARKDPKVSIDK